MEQPKDPSGEKPLRVRRGRVDSVNLYEVKENELDLLENGSPGGIYLNFAIFLLSIVFAAVVSICTSTFKSPKIEMIFMIVSVVGLLGGVFLLLLWWQTHRSLSDVVRRIRDRIPSDQEVTSSSSSGSTLVEPPSS